MSNDSDKKALMETIVKHFMANSVNAEEANKKWLEAMPKNRPPSSVEIGTISMDKDGWSTRISTDYMEDKSGASIAISTHVVRKEDVVTFRTETRIGFTIENESTEEKFPNLDEIMDFMDRYLKDNKVKEDR